MSVTGGTERPADRRARLTDVAAAAGVSTATVARVLKESPDVKPATREHVTRVISMLGYRPDPLAQGLKQGRSTAAMGLMMSGFTNSFQAGIASGAERHLRGIGQQLVIASTNDEDFREGETIRAMLDRRIRAALVMPNSQDLGYLLEAKRQGIPLVVVGRRPHDVDIDYVAHNDRAGVAEATSRLLRLGHERIAVIAGNPQTDRAIQRLEGFRDAHRDLGLVPDETLIRTGVVAADHAQSLAEELNSRAAPPTALLALNLGITLGALADRIRRRRDGAFIAFDHFDLAEPLGVTVIGRDPQELGRVGVDLALRRIETPDAPMVGTELATELVERGSGEIAP